MLSMYNVLTGLEANTGADTNRVVLCTAATLAVTQALHSGKIINLKKVDGIAVTLPNATGTGAIYNFFVGATITSVGTTLTRGTAADVMSGIANIAETAGPLNTGFLSAANTNTITLNGTTKGGLLGDFIQLIDIALNQWWVACELAGTGTIVTPFSNT